MAADTQLDRAIERIADPTPVVVSSGPVGGATVRGPVGMPPPQRPARPPAKSATAFERDLLEALNLANPAARAATQLYYDSDPGAR